MDTYLSMKVFCQVVQSGSFTKAADLLDLSVPMTSKHVSHLEKMVQAQLLYRNNRQLKLTEQGETYYHECALALEILQQAADVASAGLTRPSGVLRVSVPLWFSCDTFAQVVASYERRYPDVELVLSLTNRHVDLNGDGEDIALRLSHQLPDNLIARKLTQLSFYLLAAPEYIEQFGQPETPADLVNHRAILPSYTDMSQTEVWRDGVKTYLQMNPSMRSNNTHMIAALIRAGAGIGYMPEWLAQEDLASGRLVRVLPEYEWKPTPLYAVYANRQFMNARVRSFIDFLVEYFSDTPLPEHIQAA